MHARHEMTEQPLFNGVARPHLIRDLATVALCLSLIGGFVAHATAPAYASPSRTASTLVASTVVPAGCPDVRAQ